MVKVVVVLRRQAQTGLDGDGDDEDSQQYTLDGGLDGRERLEGETRGVVRKEGHAGVVGRQ